MSDKAKRILDLHLKKQEARHSGVRDTGDYDVDIMGLAVELAHELIDKPRPLDRGKVLECLEALKALNSNFEDYSEYHAWHSADRVVEEINSGRLDVEEG